jgi:hypothetical protein
MPWFQDPFQAILKKLGKDVQIRQPDLFGGVLLVMISDRSSMGPLKTDQRVGNLSPRRARLSRRCKDARPQAALYRLRVAAIR